MRNGTHQAGRIADFNYRFRRGRWIRISRPFKGRTCPARSQMKLFKSREANLVHYVTGVTYARARLFNDDELAKLFVAALANTRIKDPFKLIGYVLMPDHFHLLANPVTLNITTVVGKLKGRSAASILKALRAMNKQTVRRRLQLPRPLASGQTHAVWLQDFSSIDIWSNKFIRQKLNYIHMNPVRAGLCDHPAKWRWSSYHAYFPHASLEVPIEIDWRWMWTPGELGVAAPKPPTKTLTPDKSGV